MPATDSLLILPLPELFRDDVFRIETPRLWLRWPTFDDAERLEEIAVLEAAARAAGAAPHPLLLGKATHRIATARAANAAGSGLVLALTPKAGVRAPIGLITADPARGAAVALCFLLDARHQGQGLMTEAVRGLADALLAFGPHRAIRGPARLANHAGRRVLQKCGFEAIGEAGDALSPLELSRTAWARSWLSTPGKRAASVEDGQGKDCGKEHGMCSAFAA